MNDLADLSSLGPKSLRSKHDYFERSQAQGLPNRCPLLTRCARRTFTKTFTPEGQEAEQRGWLKTAEPIVPQIEDATFAGGGNSFYVKHLCPEVALFEQGMTFPGLKGIPVTEAEYDEYWERPYRILDTGHFSECAEYIETAPHLAPAHRQSADLQRPARKALTVLEVLGAIATIIGVAVAIYVLFWGDGILKSV